MEEEGQGNETGSRKAEGGTTAPCLSKDEMEVRKVGMRREGRRKSKGGRERREGKGEEEEG
jgi:hypothetical protein